MKVQKVWVERLYLCAFAVCLLWSTSLIVCQYIVVEEESLQYGSCMEHINTQCEGESKVFFKHEAQRVDTILNQNEATLESLRGATERCLAERDELMSYLGDLVEAGKVNLDVLINPEHKEKPSCASINSLINARVAANNVLSESLSHEEQTQKHVADIENAFIERVVYDQVYLKRSLTNVDNEFAGALAAISLDNDALYDCIHGGCEATGLEDNIDNMTFAATNAYKSAHDSWVDSQTRARAAQAKLNEFQDSYNSFMKNPAFKAAMALVSLFASPPSLDVNGIFMNAFSGQLRPEKTIQEVQIELRKHQTAVLGSINDKEQQMRSAIDYHKNSSSTIVKTQQLNSSERKGSNSSTLEDYEPPDGAKLEDVHTSVRAINESSKDFLAKFINETKGVSSFVVSSPGLELPNGTENVTGSVHPPQGPTGKVEIRALSMRNWDVFLYENFTFEYFSTRWDALSSLLVLFDVVIRLIQTIQLVRKYLTLSTTLTPPIDMTDEKGALNRSENRYTIQQKLAIVVFHPFTNAVIAGIFMWLIASAMVSIYFPFFTKYVDGCVNNPLQHNGVGTFLTNNAGTFVSMYSTKDGESFASKAIVDLNNKIETICTARSQQVQTKHISQLDSLTGLSSRMLIGRSDMENLEQCLRLETIGPHVVDMATKNTCVRNSVYTVEPVAYNCSTMKPCNFKCPPPNPDRLKYSAWDSGCALEKYVHATVLSFVFSAFIYVFLQVARIMFIFGLRLFMWEAISTGRLTFIASFEPQDTLVQAPDEELTHATLHKYRRNGYILITLATLLVCIVLGLLATVTKPFEQSS